MPKGSIDAKFIERRKYFFLYKRRSILLLAGHSSAVEHYVAQYFSLGLSGNFPMLRNTDELQSILVAVLCISEHCRSSTEWELIEKSETQFLFWLF